MPESTGENIEKIKQLFELSQYKFMFKQDSSVKEHIKNKFLKDRKTVIIISHDLDLVYDISTRIVALDNGMVVLDKKKTDYTYDDFKNLNIGFPHVLEIKERLSNLGYIKNKDGIYSYDDLKNYLQKELKNE